MRNRIIYNNDAVFVGPTPSTGPHPVSSMKQLHRLDTFNFSLSRALEDVTVFGQLAPIDRVQLESPDVSVDFSYYVTDMQNELSLGFTINSGTSALSSILSGADDEKNYFRFVAPEGADAVGLSGADGAVVGIGNGYLASYSTEGSVGEFPKVNVTVDALNLAFYEDGVAQPIPAIDPVDGLAIVGQNFTIPTITAGENGQPTVLRPGDIELDISAVNILGQDSSELCIQSYNISFDLSREDIECLGSRYARSKEITFPVTVTMTIEALMNDIVEGNLADLLCEDNTYDLAVNLKENDCSGDGAIFARTELKNARLTTEDFAAAVGSNHTVSISFEGQIGGSGDLNNGVFFYGVTGYDGGGNPLGVYTP